MLTEVPALARPWTTWSMLVSRPLTEPRMLEPSLLASAVDNALKVAKMSTPPAVPLKMMSPVTEASSNWPGAVSALRTPESPA